MKRKQRFLKAVQILAPGDQLALNLAKCVPEQKLPAYPGGAALELVVALHQRTPREIRETQCRPQPEELSLGHALRIQSAHYWLQLGEIDQALLELGALSTTASNHPRAVKARVAVLQAIRNRNVLTVQE